MSTPPVAFTSHSGSRRPVLAPMNTIESLWETNPRWYQSGMIYAVHVRVYPRRN